jgi:hypothetical protein
MWGAMSSEADFIVSATAGDVEPQTSTALGHSIQTSAQHCN